MSKYTWDIPKAQGCIALLYGFMFYVHGVMFYVHGVMFYVHGVMFYVHGFMFYVRVCTYVYVRMYVYVRTYVCVYVCMYVCMYVYVSVCMYVCMYVCIMYVCMYVAIWYVQEQLFMYLCPIPCMCLDLTHVDHRLCVLVFRGYTYFQHNSRGRYIARHYEVHPCPTDDMSMYCHLPTC